MVMLMKKWLCLICSLFTFFANANANSCLSSASQLQASYQITDVDGQGKASVSKFSLYRFKNQIGYYYHDKKYGDWWTQTEQGQLNLLRYFPVYQQAIEYQANELPQPTQQKHFWQRKAQLVSAQLLAKMNRVAIQGQGCNRIEVLSYHNNDIDYHVRWLTHLNMPENVELYQGNKKLFSWQLIAVNNNLEQLREYIKQINQYQSTDFADIGDNESNPLLAKMINQGFREHKLLQ